MANDSDVQIGRMNYIFVDCENVPERDLDRIAEKRVKVIMVLGERQKSMSVSLVRKCLKYSSQVEIVETGYGGKNALDLVLAERLGEVRVTDPKGYFHIVSKDKGFDALIDYLKNNQTLAARHGSFSEIPLLMNLTERVKSLAEYFRVNPKNRPKKRKALGGQIQAMFGKALSPKELEGTIQGLITAKNISITPAGAVDYLA